MTQVYVVQHLHVILPQEEEDVKLIGVYTTREAAELAVGRLSQQPGFRDHPKIVDFEKDVDQQGFHIDMYPLDLDHWAEGYIAV